MLKRAISARKRALQRSVKRALSLKAEESEPWSIFDIPALVTRDVRM